MKLIVKHDRNIQVRRCSAFSGTGDKMNYTLTRKEFHSILQWHAIPSGLKLSEKNDSFCSRTIGLDIQWHCVMPVWSPGKAKSTDMRGFPLTFDFHSNELELFGFLFSETCIINQSARKEYFSVIQYWGIQNFLKKWKVFGILEKKIFYSLNI